MRNKIMAIAAISVAALFAQPALAEGVIKLRIGHITSLSSITGQGSTKFAETVRALSKGTMQVDIYPNGQLGGELEMLSQVRLGTLDLEVMGSGIVASIEPAFSVTELPFIWKSGDSAKKVLNGPIGQKILDRLDSKGIKGLAWGAWGLRGFMTTNFEVKTPADLKGRKIRIIENPLYVRTIQSLGGSPVPMAWPEVYPALQQRAIDGLETNYLGMADGKLQEVAKNLSLTNHIFTATVFIMNMNRFQSLTSEQRDIIIKAAKAGGEVMFQGAGKANQDAIDVMEKAGVKVIKPDIEPFRNAVMPVREYFSKLIGPELVEEVTAAQR